MTAQQWLDENCYIWPDKIVISDFQVSSLEGDLRSQVEELIGTGWIFPSRSETGYIDVEEYISAERLSQIRRAGE